VGLFILNLSPFTTLVNGNFKELETEAGIPFAIQGENSTRCTFLSTNILGTWVLPGDHGAIDPGTEDLHELARRGEKRC
jgi:hypothetical protein